MVSRLHSLTVSQSMAIVFLSGFAIAVLLASNSVFRTHAMYRSASEDLELLATVRHLDSLANAILSEELISLSQQASGAEDDGPLQSQRARTDQILAGYRPDTFSNTAGNPSSVPLALDPSRFAQEVRSYRDGVGQRSWARDEQSPGVDTLMEHLSSTVVWISTKSNSSLVSARIRDIGHLIMVKSSLSREARIGLHMIDESVAGTAGSDWPGAALRVHSLASGVALSRAVATGDANLGAQLNLWARSRAVTATVNLRSDLLAALTGEAEMPRSEDWSEAYRRAINSLAAVEASSIQRLGTIIRKNMASLLNTELLDLGVLLVPFFVFGGLAFLVLRGVNRSIGALTNSVRELSEDATLAQIPSCPQTDLDQIAEALRVLKATQITQARRHEEEAQLSLRIDRKLDSVMQATANGRGKQRIDLLGLDAHGAVLARGINRLLDQIEHNEDQPITSRRTGT